MEIKNYNTTNKNKEINFNIVFDKIKNRNIREDGNIELLFVVRKKYISFNVNNYDDKFIAKNSFTVFTFLNIENFLKTDYDIRRLTYTVLYLLKLFLTTKLSQTIFFHYVDLEDLYYAAKKEYFFSRSDILDKIKIGDENE